MTYKYFKPNEELISDLLSLGVYDETFIYIDLLDISNASGFLDGDLINYLFVLPIFKNQLTSHDVLNEIIKQILPFNYKYIASVHNPIRNPDFNVNRLKFPIIQVELIIEGLLHGTF